MSSTRSINDKPYDAFIREQIAGDLRPAGSRQQRDEQLFATGFLALGVKDVNQRFKVRFEMDNIDEQIDTVSRSVLASRRAARGATITSSIRFRRPTITRGRHFS